MLFRSDSDAKIIARTSDASAGQTDARQTGIEATGATIMVAAGDVVTPNVPQTTDGPREAGHDGGWVSCTVTGTHQDLAKNKLDKSYNIIAFRF